MQLFRKKKLKKEELTGYTIHSFLAKIEDEESKKPFSSKHNYT